MDLSILPNDMINEILSFLDLFSLIDLGDTCKYLKLLSKNKINEFKNKWENLFEIKNKGYCSDVKYQGRLIGEIYSLHCYFPVKYTTWPSNKFNLILNWIKTNIRKIRSIDSKLKLESIREISYFDFGNELYFESRIFEEKVIVLKYLYYFATNYKIEE